MFNVHFSLCTARGSSLRFALVSEFNQEVRPYNHKSRIRLKRPNPTPGPRQNLSYTLLSLTYQAHLLLRLYNTCYSTIHSTLIALEHGLHGTDLSFNKSEVYLFSPAKP